MPDNGEVNSVNENALANQPISRSKTYGGTAGNAYTAMSGSAISSLTFIKGTYYTLQGVTVVFDNGSSITIGSTSNPVSTTTVDLTRNTVSKLYVNLQSASGFGSGVGIGGIYLETVHGETYTSLPGSTPINQPKSWTPVVTSTDNDPISNAVLVGITGTSGTAIDSMAFYFKNDMLMSHGMTNLVYGTFDTSPSTPMNVATATLSNQTGQTQQMSISFSESVASSYTFSTTAGATAGLSTTVEAGLPFVAKGQVEVSATFSFSATMGVAKTVTKTFTYNANVNVGPGETIQASAIASTYTLSGSYTAFFSEVWVHAGAVTKSVTGTINGVSAYDVSVSYQNV